MHDIHIVVMRIETGKTNGLKTLYGRVIRHSDKNLCAIGALGFYLAYRFHILNEVPLAICFSFYFLIFAQKVIDFTENSAWFNIKLLVDANLRDTEKSMKDQTYATAIKKVCRELNIQTKHYVHIGRGIGATAAELEELDSSFIKILGNWNPDTQEDRYSSKLPMPAMRVMAGHRKEKGVFYLPRSSVQPSEALQRQTFPFIEPAMESICDLEPPKPTAAAFLKLLTNLRAVILQDTAVMLSKKRSHVLFELPV